MAARTIHFEERSFELGEILVDSPVSTLFLGTSDDSKRRVVLHFLKSRYWTTLPDAERQGYLQASPKGPGLAQGMSLPREVFHSHFGCLQVLEPGPGEFLSEWLDKHPPESITDAAALQFMRSLARTLSLARKEGFHHGWIKPMDIYLANGELEYPILLNWNQQNTRQHQIPIATTFNESFYFLPFEALSKDVEPSPTTTDIYSLAMVVYYLLQRSFPYKARDVSTYALQMVHRAPIDPTLRCPDRLPIFLRILKKMLSKVPQQRYQTLEGLLYDLESLREGRNDFALGRRDPSREFIEHVYLVGREQALDSLHSAWSSTLNEHVVVSVVLGKAGLGKTSLIHRFVEEVSAPGIDVFTRKLEPQNQNRPFEALEGFITSLLVTLADSKESEILAWVERIEDELEDGILLLFNRFPLFKDVFLKVKAIPKKVSYLDFTVSHMNQLVARLMKHLAAPGDPKVLAIDDLQWADSASLSVMGKLAESPAGSSGRLLIVGSAKEEVVAGHPELKALLQSVPEKRTIRLRPLDPLQSLKVLEHLFDEQAPWLDHINQRLYPSTEGNPFSLVFGLKALLHAEALILDKEEGGWTVDEEFLQRHGKGMQRLNWAKVRLSALSQAGKGLAALLAIMGAGSTSEELEHVMSDVRRLGRPIYGLRAGDLSRCINEVLEKEVIARTPKGGLVFLHDSLREEAMGLTSDEEKSCIHGTFAQFQIQRSLTSFDAIFRIANHLQQSHDIADPGRARDIFVKAAQYAESFHSFPLAHSYWESAYRLYSPTPAQTSSEHRDWMVIGERVAFHRGLAGDIELCIDVYVKLLEHEKRPQNRARIFAKISEYNLARFHYRASLEAGFLGLEELNVKVIRNEAKAWLTIIGLSLPLGIYVLLLSLFSRRLKELPEKDDDKFQLRLAVVVPLYFRQPVLAIANLFPLSFALLRYKDHEVRQLLLCYWAVALSQFNLTRASFRCFSRASIFFESRNMDVHKGFSLFVWGYTCEFLADAIDKAETRVKDAASIFESLGERFWRCLCYQALTHVDYFGKNNGQASNMIPMLLESCDRLKAMSTPKNCAIKYYMAQNDFASAKGVVAELLKDLNDERHGDHLSLDTLFSHLSIGEYYVHLGQHKEAEEHLQKAFWLCFRHLHRVAYAVLSPVSYARILTLRGRRGRALGVLAFAWLNQLLKARIFFSPTCYATAEWLASLRIHRLARAIAGLGLKRAENKQHKAMAAEGHACFVELWKAKDPLRADQHRRQAIMIYESINWPFFAAKLRSQAEESAGAYGSKRNT